MPQDTSVDIQRRLPYLAAFVIVFTVALFVRLWFLQVVKGDYYYDLAENNRIRPVKIGPPRGIIYDRKGRPFVENVLVFDIALVPEDAQDLGASSAASNCSDEVPEKSSMANDSTPGQSPLA